MNRKHWYSDCDIKKKGHSDVIFLTVFCLLFGTALIAGVFLLPPDWLDYYPAPMAMIVGPFCLYCGVVFLSSSCSYVIYTEEHINVKTLLHTRETAWSDLTTYIKLNLVIGESAHYKDTVVPCYLVSRNRSSIEEAYHEIIEKRVNQYTEELMSCTIYHVVHEKKFRDIYVLPASTEVERLVQEKQLTRYRKQWYAPV